MNIVVWLLEFAVCWLICVLVVTNMEPHVTRFSEWIDSRLLKRNAPRTLAVRPIESRVDEDQIRRK